jgi:CheY-like chemotaxis protein
MHPRALIVEDEAGAADALARMLRARGLDPMVVGRGRDAIALARWHRPDLILLDLGLPDLDGYTVCEELKLDRATSLIPIIMVTGRDGHEDRVHGLTVGANRYLTKPFTLEQLNQSIDEVFAWRRALEHHGSQGEIHFQLNSDVRYLEELNELLASLFLFSGLTEPEVKRLITAVREIGTNAIEWGHRHQADLLVTVVYRIEPDRVTIAIRDTGPGFDPARLPHAARPGDPVSHIAVREALGLREGGYGLSLVRGMVDELHFNEAGNEARLIKYVDARAKVNGAKDGHRDRPAATDRTA